MGKNISFPLEILKQVAIHESIAGMKPRYNRLMDDIVCFFCQQRSQENNLFLNEQITSEQMRNSEWKKLTMLDYFIFFSFFLSPRIFFYFIILVKNISLPQISR